MENESGTTGRDSKVIIDGDTAQILAAKESKPDATERDIARKTGIPKSTVHDKLKRVQESEPIQAVRRGIISLLPDAKGVYTETLTVRTCPHCNNGPNASLRLTAARDVFKGLGIFKDHSKNENSSIPVTPEQLVEAIFALDDDGYAEFTSIFNERVRELRDSVVASQADPAPVVVGEDPTPDA